MTLRIAINGYGRIGRQILRVVFEHKMTDKFEIVAVNATGDLVLNTHLTRFDTVHGRFPATISHNTTHMSIDGHEIRFFSTRDPADLPWGELDIDLVMECTGTFTSKKKCHAHLNAGAKKVLISAPADDVDATVVYGVNHHVLTSHMTVVSNASCTTNCLAPVAKVLHDNLGIVKGLMTTIHSFTNDQVLADGYHPDIRRARSATGNIIPTKTGAAQAVGLVLPELSGKLDGFALRVPTLNVSLVDLTVETACDTTVDEVNAILKTAADGQMRGILGYNSLPLVSVDFNHTSEASIFDASLTNVCNNNLVKTLCWYDNEWAFSHQMLNTAHAMFASH